LPRLSLYRPEKGNDYKFIDKTAWEMFQIGGVDVMIHKYLGSSNSAATESPTTPVYDSLDPTQIQDLLFLENRDRKYSDDVYILRGVYGISDIDFNLSQFGLFLQNDTLFITFHINDTVEKLGRKLISGDVIELPHLKDDHALNDLTFALKRFYVIEDVNRAAEGFSVTWYPHLYRAKCVPLVDSQEFKDILDRIADSDAFVGEWNAEATYYPGEVITGPDGIKYTVTQEVTGIAPPDLTYYEQASTLRDVVSTYEKEMQITNAVLNQAELDIPKSGYDTTAFYTLQEDENGLAELASAHDVNTLSSVQRQAVDENGVPLVDSNGDPIFVGLTASSLLASPELSGYNGYITEDGKPPNGIPFSAGIAFPLVPGTGQFHLRTDYKPNRLFRYNGRRWVKVEDNLRMTLTNTGFENTQAGEQMEGKEVRQTQKASFINNENVNTIDGKQVKEKQSLSKILRPKADE
jgi:hypothetical protein